MWGNTFGWKISAIILAVAVAVGAWLYSQMQITDPTSFSLDEKNLAELSPIGQKLFGPTASGDAAKQYLQAVTAYRDDTDATQGFAAKPQGTPPRAVQILLDAANLAGPVFQARPDQIIDYQNQHPDLDDLTELGGLLGRIGLLFQQAKNPQEAKRYYEAEYSLGRNLYNEQLNHDEFTSGQGLMDGATVNLSELEPDDRSLKEALAAQESIIQGNQERVAKIWEVLSSASQERIAANAGDVFRFAAKSKERMFRVEAILKLGRYRFDAARAADQLAAPRVLRNLEQDPDPVIQAAARAAANLTIEQYRMIH